jgi:hypothetical protein
MEKTMKSACATIAVLVCMSVVEAREPVTINTLHHAPVLLKILPSKFAYRLFWFDSERNAVCMVTKSHYSDSSAPAGFNNSFYRTWCSPYKLDSSEISAARCIAQNGKWSERSENLVEITPTKVLNTRYEGLKKPPVNLPNLTSTWISCLNKDQWWIAQIPRKYGALKPEFTFHPPKAARFLTEVPISLDSQNTFRLSIPKHFFFSFDGTSNPITFDMASTDGKSQIILRDAMNNHTAEPKFGIGSDTFVVRLYNIRGTKEPSLTLRIWGWD